MSKMPSQESQSFDCSAYLSHGLKWPENEYRNDQNWLEATGGTRRRSEYNTKCIEKPEIESTASLNCSANFLRWIHIPDRKQNTLLKKDSHDVFQKTRYEDKILDEHYYKSEYSNLIKWINEEEIIVPPPSQFADKRDEIQHISLQAEKAFCRSFSLKDLQCSAREEKSCISQNPEREAVLNSIGNPQNTDFEINNANETLNSGQPCNYSYANLANEVAIKAIESPCETPSAWSHNGFQSFVQEQLIGFGEVNVKQGDQHNRRKRRLCRHFVKGFCLRGDSCDFLHDPSVLCTDEQKIFLGGLPPHLTAETLKSKLEGQGLIILNKPRIMRGFTPQVCLHSAKVAERLVNQRFIFIDDNRVDVRPYQDRDQLRKGLPSVVKRSVFLGGLPEGTTGEMIIEDLQRLDVKVVDFPVVKDGYAPRVVLGSVEHAKMLVSLKRVMVNATVVDVRPYVNFRKRY